jgi:hypothetical protein
MMMGCELWGKAVEAMGSVSRASQEDERPAGAAPIQHFKLNTLLDGHKLNLVWRGIRLCGRFQRKYEQCNHDKKQVPQFAHKTLQKRRSLPSLTQANSWLRANERCQGVARAKMG